MRIVGGDYAASEAETPVGGINDSKLPRRDTLHWLRALDDVASGSDARQSGTDKLGHMAVFEHDWFRGAFSGPRIARNPVHLVEAYRASILALSAIAAAYIDGIVGYVLAHDIPWAAAQSEPLALADRMEPVAAVLAEFAAGLYLDDRPRTLAEMTADEIIVIDLAEKADTAPWPCGAPPI